MAKADAELGLKGVDKEDFLFKEVFSDNAVPDKYLREAVELVLREGNSKTMTQLLTGHYEQRVTLLRSAMELIVEEKSMARLAMMNKMPKEASKDAIEFESDKLEEEYALKQAEAESNVKSRLGVVHSNQQEQLKDFHSKIVDSIVDIYSSNKDNLTVQSGQFNTYRQSLKSLSDQFDKDLKEDRAAIDNELKDEFNSQMTKLQDAIAESTRLVEEKMEKRKQEMLRQRQELEKKQVDESSELDNMEKKRILDSFEKEASAQAEALLQEKENKKAKLKERLQNKKKGVTSQKMNIDDLSSIAAAPDFAVLAPALQIASSPLQQLQAAIKEQQTQPVSSGGISLAQANSITSSIGVIDTKLERIEKLMQALDPSTTRGSSATPAASTVDGINKIMLDRFEKLTQLIEGSSQSAAKAAPQSPVKAPTQQAVAASTVAALSYKDDYEPDNGERLEIVKDGDLHIQERARLDFGRRLATITGLNGLKIVAAKSLAPPPKTYSNNVFKNSYLYNPKDNVLFIHSSKLSSSGDFGLCVIHALSHVKADADNSYAFSDDNSAAFITEFYKNLKILSQDLFKQTAVVGGAAADIRAPNVEGSNAFPRKGSINRAQSAIFSKSLTSPNPNSMAETAASEDKQLPDPFNSEAFNDRIMQYAMVGGVPSDMVAKYIKNKSSGGGGGNY